MSNNQTQLDAGLRLTIAENELKEIMNDLKARGYDTKRLSTAIVHFARVYHVFNSLCRIHAEEQELTAQMPPRLMSDQ